MQYKLILYHNLSYPNEIRIDCQTISIWGEINRVKCWFHFSIIIEIHDVVEEMPQLQLNAIYKCVNSLVYESHFTSNAFVIGEAPLGK